MKKTEFNCEMDQNCTYVQPVCFDVFANEKLPFQVLVYSKRSKMFKHACLFQRT